MSHPPPTPRLAQISHHRKKKRLAVYQQRMNPEGPILQSALMPQLDYIFEVRTKKRRKNNTDDNAYQSHAVRGFLMPPLILVSCLFVGSLGLKVTTSPTNTTEMRSCCHRYGSLFLHSSHENEWQNAVKGVFKCCTEPAAGVVVHSNCVCFNFHLNNRCLTRL